MKPRHRDDRMRSLTFLLLALIYGGVMLAQFQHVQWPATASTDSEPAVATPTLRANVETVPTVSATISQMQTPAPVVVAEVQTPAPVEATAETPVVPIPVQTGAPLTRMRGRKTMVLLANYRDSKRCGETLQSMFANAVSPELLKVSIHDQIYEQSGELPCVEAYCQLVGDTACRREQIVSSQISAKNATGPIPARYITEQRISDEDFCLGIDSHLVFMPNWDEDVAQQWEETENENAIITVYPKVTQYLTDHSKDNYMGLMCLARIETNDVDNMIQYRGVRWIPKSTDTKPRLMSQFAGGFNFGTCKPYVEVPNDPHLPYLFYGEEYHRGARMWTAGYDFYAPSVDVVYHHYEERKRIWEQDWSRQWPILFRSRRRARHIMGLPVSSDDFDHDELDKFGLGTKRTFEQWKQFSGIDPLAKWTDKTQDQFVNCGELQYVPFEK